jgi:predicted O-methyltransferase YrrM
LARPSIDQLLALLLGLPARTSVTAVEAGLLVDLAHGRTSVVEVGVYQGATSARLAAAMAPDGCLWLVDSFTRSTLPERLVGLSFNHRLARRSVRPFRDRVRFVRQTSVAAARGLELEAPADLIFVDADHSYEAVRADFLAWGPHLAPAGAMAFHDSRLCSARPDLTWDTGPVRLATEILRGDHGSWEMAGAADSVTAFRRRSPAIV